MRERKKDIVRERERKKVNVFLCVRDYDKCNSLNGSGKDIKIEAVPNITKN
jgi:hypothetical protein